ncbi:MAG: efflux RND transporter permease subunit [Burkholderiales bacterium]|nr:efflux RND transporter permease subunit [Phycisphaerae bacterium]
MIARIIEYSVKNRFLVLILAAMVTAAGAWAALHMRLDAIPDLSDVQVIVTTEYPGQNPQVVDDQITYPLTSALLSVPGAKDVRGFSMFEQSFVYVIFDDNTDIYWARSRVLEYLNFARDRMPKGVEPKLGPDATGLGWVYQYVIYPGWYCPDHPQKRGYEAPGVCPIDGQPLVQSEQDLASLRSLQDWYLRYPLTSVEGVSEVASIGGFVRQYQVIVDPLRLQAFGLSIRDVMDSVQRSNNDVGGSVIEQAESELMIRSRGYLRGIADIEKISVGKSSAGTGMSGAPAGAGMSAAASSTLGTPVLLRDVATVQIGGEMRRGVGEIDGLGEAVGGVVVARFGENARQVINDARAKLTDLERGLPPGVYIKTTYDRSHLIERAVGTLRRAVIECLIVTAIICAAFLLHLRSALVAILVLPIGLMASILLMNQIGINANIMSLGGLALSIGIMVDSAIVMIENAHKHLEDEPDLRRDQAILRAAQEVGPSLFFSLLIIVVSFLPIFVLEEQAGRLFKPLAYTKTFAIAAGALLGITVVPVLMTLLIRGRIPHEDRNPLSRLSQRIYEPAFWLVMRHPWLTIGVVVLLGLSTIYPITRIGSEFMPALDEGDLLYMPTVDPSVSIAKSKEILQQTDKLIKTFPEVLSVHGKIGRAESATDPAPLSMIETVVQLQPDRSKWRSRSVNRFFSDWPGWMKRPFTATFWPESSPVTISELKLGWTDADGTQHAGLNTVVTFPGMANAWPYPIENRLTMLSTGIKTPVGIKIMGPDLEQLSALAESAANIVRTIPGTLSAYPERTTGGYYLDFDIDREAAARYGLTTGDIQDIIQTAIGGMNVTTTVEGQERYPLNVRYARELRDNVPALQQVLVPTMNGAQIPLGQLAKIGITPGPPMIRSEDAQRAAFVYVDLTGRDLGGYVAEAREKINAQLKLPPGYTVVWSGQFEYWERTVPRLIASVIIAIVAIVLLLYVSNGSWFRVGVIVLAVPFSLIGAFWFLWLLDYNFSLAVCVGIIALLGIDAETGQVMLLYLNNTYDKAAGEGRMKTHDDLLAAIHGGAVKRIRPKTMTVATAMLGLLPLLWATGTGADVMRRLVAPLIGGISVSFVMELLVYPVIFYLAKRKTVAAETL